MSGLLVTGASGHVGGAVLACARALGLRATAALRAGDAGDGPSVRFDFADPGTWPASLDGHDRLFLMRPPAISDVRRTLLPFVDHARRRGVRHIVFLSVAGADRNRWVPHRAVEDRLRAGPPDWTLLRPGFFAQNLESAYRRDILEDHRLYVPAGHAPVNWIDARDIGEAAARILLDPAPHRGRAYTLTGPGAVAWEEVACLLSEAGGRPVRYEAASVPGYVAHLARRGLPVAAITVQTILHVLLRHGQGAAFDPALAALLGRPPRDIADYIADRAALWR